LVADARLSPPRPAPHTAALTQKALKQEKAEALPWFPKGADVNTLGASVRNSLKEELGKTPPEARNSVGKLLATLTRAIAKMSAGASWVAMVTRACKSATKRLRWIRANGGKQIVGKPWKS
jgi:hypothetical protein